MAKWTPKTIERLKWDDSKSPTTPQMHRHPSIPGLHVRLQPTGTKTYVFLLKHQNEKHYETIGNAAAVSLEDAEKQAIGMYQNVIAGKVPKAPPPQPLCTWNELWKEYWERYGSTKKSGSFDEYRYEKYIKKLWGDYPLDYVTRNKVMLEFEKISKHSQAEGNQFLALVSLLWNRSIDYEKWPADKQIPRNPATGIEKHSFESRARFVTHAEVPQLIAALGQEDDGYLKACIMFLMLTGIRKGAARKLKWEDVDLEHGVITLTKENAKNKKTSHRHFPAVVFEILKAIPRQEGNPYVFVGRRPGSHLGPMNTQWRRIIKASGLQDVRIHDLRRSVGSWIVQATGNLELVRDALEHGDLKMSRVYGRFAKSQATEALEGVAETLTPMLKKLLPEASSAGSPDSGEGPASGT